MKNSTNQQQPRDVRGGISAACYWAAGRRADPGHIQTTLDALGVGALAQLRPDALSGGQAQRVALARAVLLAPALLLVDEPTASLDDAAAFEALGLLRRLTRERGASLVLATHDRRVLQAWDADAPGEPVQRWVLPAQAGAGLP